MALAVINVEKPREAQISTREVPQNLQKYQVIF